MSHLFFMKYGSPAQREKSIKPAIAHIQHDAEHTEDSVERMTSHLWHHVDQHGSNPELKKFLLHVEDMLANDED